MALHTDLFEDISVLRIDFISAHYKSIHAPASPRIPFTHYAQVQDTAWDGRPGGRAEAIMCSYAAFDGYTNYYMYRRR